MMPFAAGGMAQLFIAKAVGFGNVERIVALKAILPAHSGHPSVVAMFFDEANVTASMNHANTVKIFDFGETNGRYYIAMEYVHGLDLRTLTQKLAADKRPFSYEYAVLIARGVAAGLAHAHSRTDPKGRPLRLVHRDVSPANVLLGYDGSIKLVDFGIAKADANSIETASGVIKGKAAYMSPEQCRGRKLDHRSDVFALGILLYEMTTEQRCFRADNDYETMQRIATGSYTRPHKLRRDFPPTLEAIIVKALAVEIADRYQSANAMLADLEGLVLPGRTERGALSMSHWLREIFGDVPEPWVGPAPSVRSFAPRRGPAPSVRSFAPRQGPAPSVRSFAPRQGPAPSVRSFAPRQESAHPVPVARAVGFSAMDFDNSPTLDRSVRPSGIDLFSPNRNDESVTANLILRNLEVQDANEQDLAIGDMTNTDQMIAPLDLGNEPTVVPSRQNALRDLVRKADEPARTKRHSDVPRLATTPGHEPAKTPVSLPNLADPFKAANPPTPDRAAGPANATRPKTTTDIPSIRMLPIAPRMILPITQPAEAIAATEAAADSQDRLRTPAYSSLPGVSITQSYFLRSAEKPPPRRQRWQLRVVVIALLMAVGALAATAWYLSQ